MEYPASIAQYKKRRRRKANYRIPKELPAPMSLTEENKIAVDSGWGWVVVVASFSSACLYAGWLYVNGIFYAEFKKLYQQSAAVTSMFIAIMTGVSYLIAPFASALITHYGCRATSQIGSCFLTAGLFLSTIFDGSIHYHNVTLGFISGVGVGILYVTSVVSITFWFDRKLPIATGIASCGAGVGAVIFSLVGSTFMIRYGWKGAMLMLSALASLNIPLTSLYYDPNDEEWQDHYSELPPLKEQIMNIVQETINFEMLKLSKPFLWFAVSNFLLSFSLFMPLIIMGDRVQGMQIGDQQQTAMVYVNFGIGSICGKIMSNGVSNARLLRSLTIYVINTVCFGLFILATLAASSMTHMYIAYFGIGIFYGSVISILPIVLAEMCGRSNISNSIGIVLFFTAFGSTTGPPLINLTVKKQIPPVNNTAVAQDIYRWPILMVGGFAILSVVILIPLLCTNYEAPLTTIRLSTRRSRSPRTIKRNEPLSEASLQELLQRSIPLYGPLAKSD